MTLRFVHVGNKNPAWLQSALQDLDKKMSRYFKVDRHLIKSPSIERDEAARKRKIEADLILKFLSPNAHLVLLDEKGQGFSGSQDFSKNFQSVVSGSSSEVIFLIGGAYGVDDEVRSQAKHVWQLSPLTMNHHLAQLALSEQVYRAIAIWKGLPYHN